MVLCCLHVDSGSTLLAWVLSDRVSPVQRQGLVRRVPAAQGGGGDRTYTTRYVRRYVRLYYGVLILMQVAVRQMWRCTGLRTPSAIQRCKPSRRSIARYVPQTSTAETGAYFRSEARPAKSAAPLLFVCMPSQRTRIMKSHYTRHSLVHSCEHAPALWLKVYPSVSASRHEEPAIDTCLALAHLLLFAALPHSHLPKSFSVGICSVVSSSSQSPPNRPGFERYARVLVLTRHGVPHMPATSR